MVGYERQLQGVATGAITSEMRRKADPPLCTPFYARAPPPIEEALHDPVSAQISSAGQME